MEANKKTERMTVPYFQVPNAVFDELELPALAKIVLMYLIRCGNQGSIVRPSYKTIADKCGMTRPTAIAAIKTLEKKGLVEITQRRKSNKDNDTNIYKIPSKGALLGLVKEIDQPSKGALPNKELPIKNSLKRTSEGSVLENQKPTMHFNLFTKNLPPKEKRSYGEQIRAIHYFLERYKEERGKEHPPLQPETWQLALETLFQGKNQYGKDIDFDLGSIKAMVDGGYFTKKYANSCDYNLPHFNSDKIKLYLFYEFAYT